MLPEAQAGRKQDLDNLDNRGTGPVLRATHPAAPIPARIPSRLGVDQSFAIFFSKFAVGSRNAEILRNLRAGLEPRARNSYSILRTSKILRFHRLKKGQFLKKSRAARARKPDPHLKNQIFV